MHWELIIEMVLVLKKLEVWTLYVHIEAQVNHRGLGVKVETNWDSDLIPRHSFQSTTFSNWVLKFMCVFVCSLVAYKANLRQSCVFVEKSPGDLSVYSEVGIRTSLSQYRFHLKQKPIAIAVLLCKLRSFNNF